MRRPRLCLLIFLFVSTIAGAQDTWQKECAELGVLLQWHSGDTVADIGAGKGKLTLLAVERVGPSGRVYSTETDLQSLAALKGLSARPRQCLAAELSPETFCTFPREFSSDRRQ